MTVLAPHGSPTLPRQTFRTDYTRLRDGRVRPYLFVQIGIGARRSARVPMLVDTGADACFVDHQIAYSVGINPIDGGAIGTVLGISSEQPTARYPVDLHVPSLELTMRVDVLFSILNMPGLNGLLGHAGFLERFRRVSFYPGESFELELRPEADRASVVR